MEKGKYTKREKDNDHSEENHQEQQKGVSESRKGQSSAEAPHPENSSTVQPDEVCNVAAAAAAAAVETNSNLVAKVLIRYYKMKDIREKRQKVDPNVANVDIHAAEQPQQEDSKKPAQRLGHSQETNSNPVKSTAGTSESLDQENRKSSITLFQASPDTSSQSKFMIVPATNVVPLLPAPLDVLFGRRTRQRNNPGNIRLRELCFTFYDEYKGGSRRQKTALTRRIFHKIQVEGGRFLKFNAITNGWSEVDNNTAREKVAFTIRDLPYSLPNESIRK